MLTVSPSFRFIKTLGFCPFPPAVFQKFEPASQGLPQHSPVFSEVLGVAFWKSWLNYIDIAVSVISVAPRWRLRVLTKWWKEGLKKSQDSLDVWICWELLVFPLNAEGLRMFEVCS